MNIIKAICYQIYEWNKRDFWLISVLCMASGILFSLYDVHSLIQVTVILLLLVRIFYFTKAASVLPSLGADTNQFSWKYMQSLPLNKPELLLFLIISTLFAMSPFLIWFMSFQRIFLKELFEIENYTVFTSFKILLAVIPMLLAITNQTLLTLIQFPRKQFVRKHDKILFFQKIKNIILSIAFLIYAAVAIDFMEHNLKWSILKPLGKSLELMRDIFHSWGLSVVLLAILFLVIKRTITIWQKEELSYTKINWIPKRDIPITALGLAMLYLPFISMFSTEHYYRSHEILQEIRNGNATQVKMILNRGENPNLKNEYGMTPAMAAALSGNLPLLKELENFGAKREGILDLKEERRLDGIDIFLAAIRSKNVETVKYLLDSGHSPDTKNTKYNYYALHAAASSSVEMVDLLISQGANVQVKNAIGETALHVASRYRSWASVVSLQEAGIDPLLKDNQGKIAIDYAYKKGDIHYYLQKKSRVPASKGPIESVK